MSTFQNKIAFFQPGLVDDSIENIYWLTHRPIAPIQEGSVVEFSIPGTSKDLIDLSKSKFCINFKIVYSDGASIEATSKIAPVNLTLHSLWRQVEVLLNQTGVSNTTGINNPYKCLLDVLLKEGEGAKKSLLESEMYYKDKNKMDSVDKLLTDNSGSFHRGKLVESSRTADVIGSLRFTDLAQQDKLILNGVGLIIRFFPTTDAFRLMDGEEEKKFKVEIEDMRLHLCYVDLKPDTIVSMEAQLSTTPAVYDYMRSVIKTYNIAKDSYGFGADDLFAGQVPSKLIAALVLSEAYSGSTSKNPFNFQHFDLNFIEFCVNSNSTPCRGFELNFTSGQYIEAFNALAQTKVVERSGNDINRDDFANGYTIYCFNIDSNWIKGLIPQKKTGHTRISLRFSKALEASVTLILYAVFPDQFKIDKSRAIIQS